MNPSQSQGYLDGLTQIKKSLAHDKRYTHYQWCSSQLRSDANLIDHINGLDRKQKSKLRAHMLIGQVEDSVRNQLLAEMQVADEENRVRQ